MILYWVIMDVRWVDGYIGTTELGPFVSREAAEETLRNIPPLLTEWGERAYLAETTLRKTAYSTSEMKEVVEYERQRYVSY